MKGNFFNREYFGGQGPWYGPLLKGYDTHISTAGIYLPKDLEYQATGWVFDDNGVLLSEKVLGRYHSEHPITINVQEVFPEARGKSGIIATLMHSLGDTPTPRINEAWTTRFVPPSGKMTGAIITSNPSNMNYPERSGRDSIYRMCSQELTITKDWKPMSWHANVSADADYDKSIEMEIVVYNQNGDELRGPNMVVAPFGTAVVDLEAIFGTDLTDLLAETNGRGGYMMYSPDGGAVGYHFLQHRTGLNLAVDHTRATLYYLRNAYGASPPNTPLAFLKSAARYLKFRLNQQV